MSNMWPSQFVFACCQCGAEAALKQEMATGTLQLRPAFSRPGFVTFKFDEPPLQPEQIQLQSTFARIWGFGLGKVQGQLLKELADSVWQAPGVEFFLSTQPIEDLHVWQRDKAVPGVKGFLPGPTSLALETEQALRNCSPLKEIRDRMPAVPRPPSRRNRWVLDVVLVEPGE